MKVLFMHRDHNFDLKQAFPWNQSDRMQDLAGTSYGTELYRCIFREVTLARDVRPNAMEPRQLRAAISSMP